MKVAAIENTNDPDYRVIIGNNSPDNRVLLPSSDVNWQLEYKFLVPPIPQNNWDPYNQTFYVWGDTDFDNYGTEGPHTISTYQFNQVAPQVMIGKCLSGSGHNYNPSWGVYTNWVIQAQYYWMNSDDTNYAICGELINVNPGDELTTKISYDSATGQITASISAPEGISSIVLTQPFPDQPTLFPSWADFFTKASAASHTDGVYAHPVLNVESHYVDVPTMCSVLPFRVSYVSIPGIPWMLSRFSVSQNGDYSCSNALADLTFSNFDTSYRYRLRTMFTGDDWSLSMNDDKQPCMSPTQTATGQFWKLVPQGDGTYWLRTQFTGDEWSLDQDPTSKQPRMSPTGNYTGQHWLLTPFGDGTFRLTTLYTGNDLSLDQDPTNKQPRMSATTNDTGQHWYLTPIEPIL